MKPPKIPCVVCKRPSKHPVCQSCLPAFAKARRRRIPTPKERLAMIARKIATGGR